MKELKVFRAEANMIPLSSVSKDFVQDVTDKYTFILYQEKTCAKCPLLEQRHSEPCDACEAYLGTRQLSKIVTKGANQYLSVPLGGTKRLENLLEAHEYKPSYVSKHADGAPFVRPLLFVREAREWQTEALAVCLERKRGIVESPPRSGKTILGVLLAAAVGKKTLIIASQREWLSQFMYSFIGKEDEPAFTNLNPKRIGFCKTVEDFDSKEICLATFQQFMNPSGRLILQEIHKKFSLVLVDECFTSDHEVLTDVGYVAIKEVADNPKAYKALSFNHYTQDQEFKPVTKGMVKKTRKLVKITVNGEVFKCTPEHPWWSADRLEYVEAKDIRVGEKVRMADFS